MSRARTLSPASDRIRCCPSGFRSPKVALANTSLITATAGEPGRSRSSNLAAGQDRNLHGREERRVRPSGCGCRGSGWRAGQADRQPGARRDQRGFAEARAAHAGDRAEPVCADRRRRRQISGSLWPALRASSWNSSTFSRLKPSSIDCRFESVRTKSPAATSISSGDGDLPHHQHVAQAEPPERMACAGAAGPRLLQRRHHVHARGLQRRSEAEQHAGQQRKCGRRRPARASSIPRAE